MSLPKIIHFRLSKSRFFHPKRQWIHFEFSKNCMEMTTTPKFACLHRLAPWSFSSYSTCQYKYDPWSKLFFVFLVFSPLSIMCGILAVHGLDKPSNYRAHFIALSKKLRHRGPDWSGCYVGQNAILVHERLAIVGVGKLPFKYLRYM